MNVRSSSEDRGLGQLITALPHSSLGGLEGGFLSTQRLSEGVV